MKPHKPSLLFLLFLLLLPLCNSSTPSYKDSHNLLSFKASLFNPTLLPDWLPSQNPCRFSGVVCNNQARVTSINLSSIPLSTNLTLVSNLFGLEVRSAIEARKLDLMMRERDEREGKVEKMEKRDRGVFWSFDKELDEAACSDLPRNQHNRVNGRRLTIWIHYQTRGLRRRTLFAA